MASLMLILIMLRIFIRNDISAARVAADKKNLQIKSVLIMLKIVSCSCRFFHLQIIVADR